MLFFSFFKTLVNHEVTVELKNDISIRGTLKSVDQYLNIKLDDISVLEEMKYPHLVCESAIKCSRLSKHTRIGHTYTTRAMKDWARKGWPYGTAWTRIYADLSRSTELSEKCVHQRQRRAIRPPSRIFGRHGLARGCYKKRYEMVALCGEGPNTDSRPTTEASQAQAKAKQG